MAERHIWTKRKANMMWIYRKRFRMPLHDTSFRKSAVSMKVRKDRRFTRNGLRNIPNTQKSEKVRWGRGDLSGLFLLTTLSEPYLHGETAFEKVGVRPMSVWWTRRDSNPRPLGCEPNALPAELQALIDFFCGIDANHLPDACATSPNLGA